MVIRTEKITLSVANATDIIVRLQELGAIPQELAYEENKNLINDICKIEL